MVATNCEFGYVSLVLNRRGVPSARLQLKSFDHVACQGGLGFL